MHGSHVCAEVAINIRHELASLPVAWSTQALKGPKCAPDCASRSANKCWASLLSYIGIMEKKRETTIMENQMEKKMETTIIENQTEKKMDNEMETREYTVDRASIQRNNTAHSSIDQPLDCTIPVNAF